MIERKQRTSAFKSIGREAAAFTFDCRSEFIKRGRLLAQGTESMWLLKQFRSNVALQNIFNIWHEPCKSIRSSKYRSKARQESRAGVSNRLARMTKQNRGTSAEIKHRFEADLRPFHLFR